MSDLVEPIPMLLHCPLCSARHVDQGRFATKTHHTHACQRCGHTWRPAVVATVGVQFLPGFKDPTPTYRWWCHQELKFVDSVTTIYKSDKPGDPDFRPTHEHRCACGGKASFVPVTEITHG